MSASASSASSSIRRLRRGLSERREPKGDPDFTYQLAIRIKTEVMLSPEMGPGSGGSSAADSLGCSNLDSSKQLWNLEGHFWLGWKKSPLQLSHSRLSAVVIEYPSSLHTRESSREPTASNLSTNRCEKQQLLSRRNFRFVWLQTR